MGAHRVKEDNLRGEKPKVEEDPNSKKAERERAERRIKQIIRLVEANLDGDKPVSAAIRKIKGVSFMFSNAVVSVGGFEGKILGKLPADEMKKLEDIINNPGKYNIPEWLYNRRAEPETGENKHMTVSKLQFVHNMDINEMKKLKTYKGVRHSFKLPVRGQRTRSSFRGGGAVGVKRGVGKSRK